MRTLLWSFLPCAAAVALFAAPAPAGTNVAVFNFQMKSKTPEWVWFEKCLADQITTDLCQGGGLSVIARDRMQLLADQIDWAPEFATGDPKRMQRIRGSLKIKYLVSGVYKIEGGKVEITAQIVSTSDRKELFRKTVRGEADDVIVVQKKVSSELMSWFTKRPAAEILPALPVWTRSVPAIKALYEGVDLYDQGRYAEGWLKFRQSSKADRAYLEAQYWVGKMYYFMDRHRHARRAIEAFVYMDQRHPRVRDAVLEYMHTYEAGPADPDLLLQVYAEIRKRFGKDAVPGVGYVDSYEEFVSDKVIGLLTRIGRAREALDALGSRPAHLSHDENVRNVRLLDALSGGSPGLEVATRLKGMTLAKGSTTVSRYLNTDGFDEVFYYENRRGRIKRVPVPLVGEVHRRQLDFPFYRSRRRRFCWIAPDGHIIKSLRVYPVTEAEAGKVTFAVTKDALGDVAEITVDLVKAVKDGVLVSNLPYTGFLEITCKVQVNEDFEDPDPLLRGIKCKAEFDKPRGFGRIRVACEGGYQFRVDVGGRLGGSGSGVIGFVPAGKHKLRFRHADPKAPYGEWTTDVQVRAGQTVSVTGRLPWKKDSGWRDWGQAAIPGAPPSSGRRNEPFDGCIVADEQAIRLLRVFDDDIWYSVSQDGKRYSPWRRQQLPVSTGWAEAQAQCVRDESGRFILMFVSNRNARHERKLYTCWSRDFVNWSAPQLVHTEVPLPSEFRYHLSADGGRLLMSVADSTGSQYRTVGIFSSGDGGARWHELGRIQVHSGPCTGITRRKDGRYELFVAHPIGRTSETVGGSRRKQSHYQWKVTRYLSKDARSWRQSGDVGKCETLESWALRIQSSRIGNRSAVFVHVGKQGSDRYRGGLVLQESPGGKWQEHRLGTDFSNKELTVAFDRKWGTIISWTDGPAGNFVIAGQGLRASAATVAIAKTPKTPKTPVKPVRPAALPPGQLRLEPGDPKRTYPLEVDGAANFKSPDSTRGPLTRRARIGVFKAGDMTFHAAADWTKARFKYPDVVRIDFSGSGDFKTSHVVKRSTMEGTQDSDSLRCWFTAESVPVRINGRDLKINLRCYYARSPTEESLLVRLGLSAVGRCYFGKKLHKVRLVDGNGNFRFDDPTKPVTRPRGAWTNTTKSDYEKCDAIEVYPSTPQPRRTMWPAYYGHPVLVDGVLYDVKVSSDATKISATPYKGATAKIRIDHDHWNAWFCGKKHIVRLSGSRQPVSLPPDVYTIVGYYQQETTKEGKRKRDNVYGVDPNSSPVTAEVKSDMTTAIPIGSPIQAVLVPRERGRTVRFDVYLVGVGGRKKAGSTPVILAARQSRSPIPRANR